MTETRTLRVGALTRVEGEGALHVELRDGVPEVVELNIYEPPRFFEAFLRGRGYTQYRSVSGRGLRILAASRAADGVGGGCVWRPISELCV